MAKGRKDLPQEKIEEIIILHNQLQSYSEVGRRLDLAPNTVKKYVLQKDKLTANSTLLQEYAKIKKSSDEQLLKNIESLQYKTIASNIMDIFNKENLQEEFNKRGIRSLVSLLGNIFDKGFAIKELEIKQKLLSIKEQELELRVTNPEAFHTVTIVNDAPIIKDDELNVYNQS